MSRSGKIKIVGMSLLLTIMWGCAHSPKDNFARLQMGMGKADVIEIMGNPTRTSRKHGSDRWTYEYEVDGKMVSNDVFFQAGKVTYIGQPPSKQNGAEQGFRDIDAEPKETSP